VKTPNFKAPLYRAIKDKNGTLYKILESKTVKTPRGQLLPGTPSIEIWWGRNQHNKQKNDELLFFRQEDEDVDKGADVIAMTLEQVYATIEALNRAVESR